MRIIHLSNTIRFVTTCLIALNLCLPFSVSARSTIEEITVTAQKRAQSIQDVGITINTFSGDELRDFNINDPIQVGVSIPNTQVSFGFGQPYFSIRGQGLNEFAQNTDSPVAVHIDEVYLSKSFQLGMGIFDMERVEALKGPQGTLFGRNTTGGSINFFTRKPTEDFEAGLNFEYSRFETARAEGYVSGALSDNVLGRISGYTLQSSDGPTYNLFDGDSLGKKDQFGLRGHLVWTMSESTEVLASVHAGVDNSDLLPYSTRGVVDATLLPGFLSARGAAFGEGGPAAAGAIPIPFCAEYLTGTVRGDSANCVNFAGFFAGEDDPFTTNQDNGSLDLSGGRRMEKDDENFGGMLRIDHELPWVILTSITAFDYYERDTYEDTEGSPTVYNHGLFYSELKQYTQELRLTSVDTGDWNWLVGFYYEHDDQDSVFTINPIADPEPVTGFVLQSTDYEQTTDAFSLFGHTEYQANEQIRLIAGARFTWERKSIDGETLIQLPFIAPVGEEDRLKTPLATLATVDDHREDSNLSFKVGLNWTPTDDSLYYASVSTGFRSGGFSANIAFADADFHPFKPEIITAYEVGFKSKLLENTLQLSGSFFHYSTDDQQINTDIPNAVLPQTDNAESGKTFGAELETWWHPVEGLNIKNGIGWLDATYGEFILGGAASKGNDAVNAPEWSYSGLVRYEQPLNNGMRIIATTDFNYRSKCFLESSNSLVSLQDGYWLLNARLALASADDTWEIALWGKNLTDEEYRSYLNDLPGLGFILDMWGMPATYGVSASYHY